MGPGVTSPLELRTADGRGRYIGAWDLDILPVTLGKDHCLVNVTCVYKIDHITCAQHEEDDDKFKLALV